MNQKIKFKNIGYWFWPMNGRYIGIVIGPKKAIYQLLSNKKY